MDCIFACSAELDARRTRVSERHQVTSPSTSTVRCFSPPLKRDRVDGQGVQTPNHFAGGRRKQGERRRRTPCTSRSTTPYTLHPTPCTLHPTPYTLHPTPCTLHPTPYTLHPAPYAVFQSLNPKPLCRGKTPMTQGWSTKIISMIKSIGTGRLSIKKNLSLQGGGRGKESGGGERVAHRARPARSSPRQRAYPRSRLDYTPQYSLARARSRARNLCSCSLSLLSLSPFSLSLSRIPTPDRDSVRTLSRASARKARGAERLVCYRRTTSASTAPRTSRRMCCPHCAGYCAPCQSLL